MILKSGLISAMLLALAGLGASPALAQASSPNAPAAPKLESRLREVIADLQAGKPKLDQMEPVLGDAVKQQQAGIAGIFAQLGPVKTIAFEGLKEGVETYRVVFQNGATNWLISTAPNGKLATLFFAQAQ